MTSRKHKCFLALEIKVHCSRFSLPSITDQMQLEETESILHFTLKEIKAGI